jgi:hypothetical protein
MPSHAVRSIIIISASTCGSSIGPFRLSSTLSLHLQNAGPSPWFPSPGGRQYRARGEGHCGHTPRCQNASAESGQTRWRAGAFWLATSSAPSRYHSQQTVLAPLIISFLTTCSIGRHALRPDRPSCLCSTLVQLDFSFPLLNETSASAPSWEQGSCKAESLDTKTFCCSHHRFEETFWLVASRTNCSGALCKAETRPVHAPFYHGCGINARWNEGESSSPKPSPSIRPHNRPTARRGLDWRSLA